MNNTLLLCTDKYVDSFLKIVKTITLDSKIKKITNEETFSKILNEEELKDFDLCIIHPELTWRDWNAQEYKGFYIARVLRRHGLMAYMYFFSLKPAENFYINNPQFSLLRANRFHKVITLPFSPETKKEVVPGRLTQEQWEDIHLSLLSLRALIRSMMHDFKNELYPISQTPDEQKLVTTVKISQQYFTSLEEILPDKINELKGIRNRIIEAFKSNIESGGKPIYELVEEYSPEIINLAPYDESEETPLAQFVTPWRVLLVEDEPDVAKIFTTAFQRNKIKYVHTTAGEQVLNLLQEDVGVNSFTVLVCDIRLKEPNSEIWQQYQGYDLIKIVRDHFSNHIALFSITSAKSLLVHLARNFQGNISIEYKNDILSSDGALNIFCQKLREAGDNFFFRARSKPNLSAWNKPTQRFFKPLAEFYRTHLLSADYVIAEENINKQASAFVANCNDQRHNKEESGFTITIKDTAGQTKADHLSKFRYFILLGRRIALTLFYKGYSEDEIYNFMQPNTNSTNSKASKDQLFKTTLSISFQKDLPQFEKIKNGKYLNSHLLLEELLYLKDIQEISFDLDLLRLTLRDRDIIWYILSDAHFTLSQKAKSLPSKLNSDWENLNSYETKALAISSIKEAKNMVALIKKLSLATSQWKQIKDVVKDQLEEIESEVLKQYLEEQVN